MWNGLIAYLNLYISPFSSLGYLPSSPVSDLDSALYTTLCYLTESYHIFPTLLLDGMTTDDKGQGSMTSLGRFSGAMPLDLRLGMLIHYGIALGSSHTHHHSHVYALASTHIHTHMYAHTNSYTHTHTHIYIYI